MAGMKEELTLIGQQIDANDPHQAIIRTERVVYADKRPLHGSEFHAAGARGFQLQLIMRIRGFEYEDERLARYNGQEYRIYRHYPMNDDWIDLYLSSKEVSP